MPIQINFNPAAGALSGASLLAGEGQYALNANQILTQQWQTAAGIQAARLQAMQQAAQAAQLQNNQQQFDLAKLPLQAQIESQQQAYHTQLGMQADAQRQGIADYYRGQQSQQDFGEQQQLSAQKAQQDAENHAAQLQLQQQGQLSNQKDMAQYNNDLQMMQSFQDGSYQKRLGDIKKQSTANGYGFTDAQELQIQKHQKTLDSASESLGPAGEGSGDATMSSLRPAVTQAMTALNNIYSNPGKPPDPTIGEVISKKVSKGIPDPNNPGQLLPGSEDTFWTIAKDGTPKMWQPKADEAMVPGEDGRLVTPKVAGQVIKNQSGQADNNMKGYTWASKMLAEEIRSDPNAQMAAVNDPTYRQRRLQELMGLFNQMNPGLVKGVHQDPNAQAQQGAPQRPEAGAEQRAGVQPSEPHRPGPPGSQMMTQQPPAGGAAAGAGAAMTGIPGQQPQNGQPQVNGQNPQGQPAQAVSQPLQPDQAMMVYERLKNLPREKWSVDDAMLWRRAVVTLQSQMQGSAVGQ